ncbi:hypothetical protein [Parasitella parasitica]|uniref:Transposase Tc1-like domain-containing protein n=1 Tax=Parasitella parasitica TaxID=35722 RepID=A0A0B7NA33_9FUNG|nr:hypothetical protein [Parasitella parasitica]
MPITAQHQYFVAGGVEMSLSTFRRRMLDLGFSSYSPARKPALSERHRLNRLKWCEERVNWTIDQWKSVVWSDESRYTVVGNDGGFRVIRKEGEKYLEQHILETHKFGKGPIMLWGCFWYGGLGPLVALTGKIDQDAYSPDLNPIEHLWAYITHKLRSKRSEIGNVAQLEAAIRKIWNGIPSIILENLVSSMPARCLAVIEAGGGHTKY